MNDEKFNDFLQAVNELDDLSLEGYFGEEVKGLVQRRDNLDTTDYLVECLDNWIKDKEQFGKDKVKELMLIFFELYTNALKIEGQKAIDVLTCFWKGTSDNPGIECTSSYMEFARINAELSLILSEIQRKSNTAISDKKKIATAVITAYSKGVELIGKILISCILLEKIEQGQELKIMEIYDLTLYKKINLFQKLSNGRYDKLVNSINRSIRNADAHLNTYFVPSRSEFVFKIKKHNKIITEKLDVLTMLMEVYPQPGWIVQAFVYSSMLLIISNNSKDRFNEKVRQVFEK